MAVTVDYDIIGGARADNSSEGVTIYRTCHIKGLVLTRNSEPVTIGSTVYPTGYSDSSVLMNAILTAVPSFPKLGDPHPDINYTTATVRMHRVKSVDKFANLVVVEIIYFAPRQAWLIEDDTNFSVIQSYCTADGSLPLGVWYKPGSIAATTQPADVIPKVHPAPKYVPHGSLKATSVIRQANWNFVKSDLKKYACYINSDSWGSDPRGTWMFLGPRTRMIETQGTNPSMSIELNFIHDRLGFYPMGIWKDLGGNHPPDSATEATIRAALPDVNTVRQRNGISLFSVQGEVAFTTLFQHVLNAEDAGFNPGGPL